MQPYRAAFPFFIVVIGGAPACANFAKKAKKRRDARRHGAVIQHLFALSGQKRTSRGHHTIFNSSCKLFVIH